MSDQVLQKLESIEAMLIEQNLLRKEALNFNEGCQYLDLSASHLYKLTSSGDIPHYKPNGKKIYFNRKELDQWLLRNRIKSTDEISEAADNFLMKKGRLKL